jgi:hypothetical protein
MGKKHRCGGVGPLRTVLQQAPAMWEDTNMTVQDTQATTGVNLSEGAASKVKTLLDQEGRDDLRLRIAVQPGGCSGLRYQLFFDERFLDGDQTSTPSRSRASPSTTRTPRVPAPAATASTDRPPNAPAPGSLREPGAVRFAADHRHMAVDTPTGCSH